MSVKKCEKCEKEIPESSDTCPHCAKNISKENTRDFSENKIDELNKSRFEENPSISEQNSSLDYNPEQKSVNMFVIICIGLVVFGISVIGINVVDLVDFKESNAKKIDSTSEPKETETQQPLTIEKRIVDNTEKINNDLINSAIGINYTESPEKSGVYNKTNTTNTDAISFFQLDTTNNTFNYLFSSELSYIYVTYYYLEGVAAWRYGVQNDASASILYSYDDQTGYGKCEDKSNGYGCASVSVSETITPLITDVISSFNIIASGAGYTKENLITN